MKAQDVIRALERCGLVVVRQRGSHVVLDARGLRRPVIVAVHKRAIPPRHLAKIIKQAGLTVEQFLDVL